MSPIRIARFATLLAVALALVVTGAVAGAAGQALILGQSNSAGANQTQLTANLSAATLKVSQFGLGSPLSLKGPDNKPPMVVNSKERVENLNADRVDGKNAGQFMPSATYRQSSGNVEIAAGDFEAFSVTCDAGDRALSGGYFDKNSTTNLLDGRPSPPASWSFHFQNQGESPDSVTAYALCADFAPAHIEALSADKPPRD